MSAHGNCVREQDGLIIRVAATAAGGGNNCGTQNTRQKHSRVPCFGGFVCLFVLRRIFVFIITSLPRTFKIYEVNLKYLNVWNFDAFKAFVFQ